MHRALFCPAFLALLACSSSDNTEGPTPDGGGSDVATVDGTSPPDTGSGDAGDAAAPAPIAVLEHHGSGTRAGFYVDPAFTKAALPGLEALPGFSASLTGPTFAQILFLEQGVKGKDALFAVTEGNAVVALDALTGAQLWSTTLGPTVPQSALPTFQGQPCGTIAPLGITGTPVIDLPSRTIVTSAMTLNGSTPDFVVAALSLDDGSTAWTESLSADLSGFDAHAQMQRGALTIANGVVYVPFGGQAGGCVPFNGWVVAVPLTGSHHASGWHTGASGGGIWAPSGAASDGTSIFVSTASPDTWGISPNWADNDIEAILRLGAGATFSGSSTDYFAPTDWFDYGVNGSQLGAAGVVLFDLAGSTPSQLALSIGKTSDAYLVDRTNLGGIGEGAVHFESATADWVEGAMAAYATSQGAYVALMAPGSFCTSPADLSTLRIQPGSPPAIHGGWCAVQGGAGSPIATASAAAAGSQPAADVVVWGLGTNSYSGAGSGKLRAFDGDTGALLAESPGAMSDLEHWVSPIVAKGRVYVAGDKHVYAFDLAGAQHPVTQPDAGATSDGGVPASCLLTTTPQQVDPCAAFGLSCQGNPQQSELGTCATPTTDQACLPSVGCGTGLACVSQGSGYACKATCTTTADCTDIFRQCAPVDGGTSVCLSAPCTGSYTACSGGTCLPFYDATGATSGVCMAAGTATAGCSTSRGTGGAAALCPEGSFCYPGGAGACLTLCDYTTAEFGGDAGGPACGAGQTCVLLSGNAGFGACAQTCGGADSGACPAGTGCQVWNPLANLSACLPQ